MWVAEITKVRGNQVFGVCDHTEFRIDTSKMLRKLKKGDKVEGYLAGGAIVAEHIVASWSDLLKFKNVEQAATFLDEQFGYTTETEEEHIVVTKEDGEKETFPSSLEIFKMANDMWNTAKQNGLSKEVVKEVEEEYSTAR